MTPLEALAEMRVELDEATRRELEGKRFSEFGRRAGRPPRRAGLRDLPPEAGALDDAQLDKVSGGVLLDEAAPRCRVQGPLSAQRSHEPQMNPRLRAALRAGRSGWGG